MRALAYFGPGRVKVVKKPDPRIEHPQDVVLRVTRAAICGSDLFLYRGLVPDTRVGCTFGHEFTGVVEELGPEVKTLKRGDRVVVPFNISCGRCFFCERGLFASCENTNPSSNDIASGVFGYSHSTGGFEGAQAEYVRVPFADVGPTRIPDDMEDEEVLFLGDILPAGYQAAEMGGIEKGETVVVFGSGPVGLFAQHSAWLMGAGRVIAVDRVPERLAFAREYSGVETLDFGKVNDPVLALREMTGGRGADVCIDAVGMEAEGTTTALAWCIQTVRKGGNVSVVGVYGPLSNLIPIGTAMNKGVTLRMNHCNVKRYLPRLLGHVREGRIDARRIITHRFPLQRAPEAYHLYEKRAGGCIKCVLLPHEEG